MFTIKWKVTGGSTSSSKKIPPQPRLLINFKNRKWLVYLQIDHYCFSHLIGFCCFLIHFTFLFEEGFSLETLDLVFGIPTYINLSLSLYIYVDLYFNIDFNVYAERLFPPPPPRLFTCLSVWLVGFPFSDHQFMFFYCVWEKIIDDQRARVVQRLPVSWISPTHDYGFRTWEIFFWIH